MRVSVWLYLMEQSLGAAAVILACARMLRLRCPLRRAALLSLLGGGASLWAAMCASPWLQAGGLLLLCALPRLALHPLPGRSGARSMQLTLVATMVSASLCSLTAQLGLPPKLVPLSACGALLLRPSATLHTDCAQLVIRKGAARVTLAALTDSGNLLQDPLTRLPVIVCARKAIAPLFPQASTEPYPTGMRLISVRTVAGTALMPLFRPDSLQLRIHGAWQDCSAVIGLAPCDYRGCQAIVPSSLTFTQGGAT